MTGTDLAERADAARAVAVAASHAFRDVFAERLIAAYALGSLAHGGYAPAVSDIDVAVILADTRDRDTDAVDTTCRGLRERGPLYGKLSVFWGSLPALRDGRDDGRFPAIDRLDLADHGVLLLGAEVAREVARPSTDGLFRDSAQFAIEVLATDEVIAEIHQANRLLRDSVWFTKAVLFPVRFLYSSARTSGRAATNDEAISWYLAQPHAAATRLVELAARVRAGRPLDPVEAAPLLAQDLVALYRRYVDEQIRLLRRTGAPADLVAAFVDWGTRLT